MKLNVDKVQTEYIHVNTILLRLFLCFILVQWARKHSLDYILVLGHAGVESSLENADDKSLH